MKRKQKDPRRIRPAETPDEQNNRLPVAYVSDSSHFCEEPLPKRVKFDLETSTKNGCDAAADSSEEWQWNIADFRKKHREDSREQSNDLNEVSKNSKEHCDLLAHPSKDSNEASSSNYSTECSNGPKKSLSNSKVSLNNSKESSSISKESSNNSKESSNNSMESSDISKQSCDKRLEDNLQHLRELLYSCKDDEKDSKEIGEGLKESHSKNSPRVLGNRTEATQNWKLPVRSLKEPSNLANTKPLSSELHSNTGLPEGKEAVTNFRNELQNDDMPVILNVFSLSKSSAPVQQLVTNTKQENSFLFTPPCSPPYVQLGPFNSIPVSSQNSRYRNEFGRQADFSQQSDFHSGVNERGRGNWYKPVQRAHYNFQEYLSYPVQQVGTNSQEYQYNPVQQVYCNSQEYFSKPVQQVSSPEYIAKPVQQVNHNPQDYYTKPVQQVNYNPLDLSKPVQQVNSQEYSYTPAQHVNFNPQQIANGVLPLEKQSSTQNTYETPVQQNTAQFYSLGYYDYVNNNEQAPPSQLKATLTRSDNYLVRRANYLAKGNGMYARFKLQQEIVENNRKSRRQATNCDVLPQFFETPGGENGSNVDVMYSNVPQTFRNHFSVSPRDTPVMFSSVTSTVDNENVVNRLPNYTNGGPVGKYRTDKGCSAIIGGYGQNRILHDHSVNPAGNTHTYVSKHSPVFESSCDTPTIVSEKYSENFSENFSENSCGSPAMVCGSYSVSENTSEHFCKFLSPRDAKVIELKQRLEEQEATLKKLRANH